MLEFSGLLDPLNILNPDHRNTLSSFEQLFPASVEHVPKSCSFKAGSRQEYLKLLSLQLRSGKVDLSSDVKSAASTFVIGMQESFIETA